MRLSEVSLAECLAPRLETNLGLKNSYCFVILTLLLNLPRLGQRLVQGSNRCADRLCFGGFANPGFHSWSGLWHRPRKNRNWGTTTFFLLT